MAPRPKPAVSSGGRNYREYSPESSPDPLNASLTSYTSKPHQRGERASQSALNSSSPSKQNRRVHISNGISQLSSPTKSLVLNTPRQGNASPWRIKVTVQAEPGDGSSDENMASPTAKRLERRTTTTVPLKDEGASKPPKRRGRPPKSDATPSTKAKRSGTPRRRKSTVEGDDATATEAPAEASPKKRRGRPRKSIQPEPEEEEVVVIDEPQPELPPFEDVDTQPTSRYVRFATQEAAQMDPTLQTRVRRRTPSFDGEEETSRKTPPGTGLHKRIRSRKGTPHAKAVKLVSQPESSDDDDGEVLTPTETDEDAENASTDGRQLSQEGPDAQSNSDALWNGEDEYDIGDATTYALDEGVTRMHDDTTIMESEEFSMVSVQSLPSYGAMNTPMSNIAAATLDKSYLGLQNETSSSSQSSGNISDSAGSISANHLVSTGVLRPEAPVASPRERQETPAMDVRSPSQPPALEQPYVPTSNSDSPEMGRAVKAGVALQGVVEPDRVSPAALTPTAIHQRNNSFDDLFRGFSEGTRKDLQAGLRLGQQLAMCEEGQADQMSSPSKAGSSRGHVDDHSSTTTTHRESRLLTPEDQEELPLPVPPASVPDAEVNYPSLQVQQPESHLVSPALSDDEMSWQVDTPPVRVEVREPGSVLTAINRQGQHIRGPDVFLEAKDDDGHRVVTAIEEHGARISGPEIYVLADKADNENYSDIWQEEADRSPEDGVPKSRSPQVQDLFTNDGPVKPARGKLPRTWRRRSSGDFQYSDEMDEPADQTAPKSSGEPPAYQMPTQLNKGKARMTVADEQRMYSDFSEASEASGIFFQPRQARFTSNELRQKPETIGESLLLDDGQSLIPESPLLRQPHETQQSDVGTSQNTCEIAEDSMLLDDGRGLFPESSPAAAPSSSKPNPFIDTPPRFTPARSSPVKSSPLRQEYRASDTEESFRQNSSIQESSLPVSSPFRTQVDVTVASVASDEQQILRELEGVTDSSIRNLRQEADAHANAYDFQERTLQDITEVTEQSRTLKSAVMPSSPPLGFLERHGEGGYHEQLQHSMLLDHESTFEPELPLRFLGSQGEGDYREDRRHSTLLDHSDTFEPESSQNLGKSILAPRKQYSPLFDKGKSAAASKEQASRPMRRTLREPIIAVAPRQEEAAPEASSTGLFSRLTSTFWGTRSDSTIPTAPSAPMPPKTKTPTPRKAPSAPTAPVAPATPSNVATPRSRARPATPASPPMHPVTTKLDLLPQVEPWTKTHYKTLDRLYQSHKKHPSLFSPAGPSSVSPTNAALLEHFLTTHKLPFVGARYSCWGYSVTMTESLIVLCAAFMQLCLLSDVDEYERFSGKEIQMGECAPGEPGTRIPAAEVVRRLATVVMGEELRRDEKRGVEVRREGDMEIVWPESG